MYTYQVMIGRKRNVTDLKPLLRTWQIDKIYFFSLFSHWELVDSRLLKPRSAMDMEHKQTIALSWFVATETGCYLSPKHN